MNDSVYRIVQRVFPDENEETNQKTLTKYPSQIAKRIERLNQSSWILRIPPILCGVDIPNSAADKQRFPTGLMIDPE
jgi:hypothetical protein